MNSQQRINAVLRRLEVTALRRLKRVNKIIRENHESMGK